MAAYYNEIDPFAAQWLRNLIAAGHIAPGEVDERSIVDVRPSDLRGFAQCHFFAGIGVWSYAMRRAGVRDDDNWWSGSCPCQPFSAAGAGEAFGDERDLWPAFRDLIRECRPRVVVGEQVASALGLAWLDLVHADLEAAGYACGAVDTCAAGFGAPHIRQRLYFVAHAVGRADQRSLPQPGQWAVEEGDGALHASGVGDAEQQGLEGLGGHGDHGGKPGRHGAHAAGSAGEAGGAGRVVDAGEVGREVALFDSSGRGAPAGKREADVRGGRGASGGIRLDDAISSGRGELGLSELLDGQRPAQRVDADGSSPPVGAPGPCNGFWADAEWLACIDGKARPVEPGTFPLAHGVAGRVGRLRAYGNAINAEQARAFLEAVIDVLPG